MEMWFSELHTSNVKLSMRIEEQLCSVESDCQRIDVLVSDEFGKFLALDGEILFSEKDEFIYDEMVTHIPMAVHPDVKNVLIIGGADGGVARELINYKCIERIDVVEPDLILSLPYLVYLSFKTKIKLFSEKMALFTLFPAILTYIMLIHSLSPLF